MKTYFTIAWISILMMFSIASNSCAEEWGEAVERDFAEKKAVVVLRVENEYLIDQDASSGVRVGDIFSRIRPGKKIVHPLTGETLGSLDELLGMLRVTRIKSGYSYAQMVGPDCEYSPGDELTRFVQIPAMVAGDDSVKIQQLKTTLPQFEWLSGVKSAKDRLQELGLNKTPINFIFKADRLLVQDGDGNLLSEYPVSQSSPAQQSVAAKIPAASPGTVLPVGLVTAAGVGTLNKQDLVRSPRLDAVINGVAIADFDGDGHREIAVGYKKKVVIMRVRDGNFQTIAEIESPPSTAVLAVDAVDLDHNGRAEIYVTGARQENVSSFRISYHSKKYVIDQKEIPWLLRVDKVNGHDRLLGQRLGETNAPFSKKIIQLVAGDAGLVVDKESRHLAGSLYGAISVPESEQPLTAVITRNDHLRVVAADGEVLWGSATEYGGTERNIVREHTDGREISFHLTPLQATMVERNGTLLIPQNDGSRLLSDSVEFESSRVVAMKWNGFAMEELWSTKKESGYLSDFEVGDADNDGRDEIVMAVVYSRKGLFSKSRAGLLIYELP